MEFQFVYVNCTSSDEAKDIGKFLVENKWAASANIIKHTLSYYWWQGEFREDRQTTLILQCRTIHMKKITEKIKSMHGYSCPLIISMAIDEGNPEFLDWMERVLPSNLTQEATDGE